MVGISGRVDEKDLPEELQYYQRPDRSEVANYAKIERRNVLVKITAIR